jgi:5-methylthioadenosine/S-adenosylhomocysteine deaminase
MAHVPIFRGEALMLNSQPLAMMRSSGTGELGVIERAELPLAGDKIAAVGNHLREGSDQILEATGKMVMPGLVDVQDHLW